MDCRYCGDETYNADICGYCSTQISFQVSGCALWRMRDTLKTIGVSYTERPGLLPRDGTLCKEIVVDKGRGSEGCVCEFYFTLHGDYLGHGVWDNQ